ncbi:MAG TPA: hypothetical protein VFM25_03490 [Verrucomicrobiae bacterium]|nr:hypothetical protein [Verrucomicrobiae bacterium]
MTKSEKLSLSGQIASWFLVALICVMEGMYVVLMLTPGKSDTTIPPIREVVTRQPRFPKLLRPLIAIFWLAHLLFIVGLIYILRNVSTDPPSLTRWIGEYVLAFLFDFLAYGYFLLAITAFTNEIKIISGLWKYRALISSIIALMSTYAPSFLPIQHQVG